MATSTGERPHELVRRFHEELCSTLDSATTSLTALTVDLFSNMIIDKPLKNLIMMKTDYSGADNLMDRVELVLDQNPDMLEKVLNIFEKQEILKNIVHQMRQRARELDLSSGRCISSTSGVLTRQRKRSLEITDSGTHAKPDTSSTTTKKPCNNNISNDTDTETTTITISTRNKTANDFRSLDPVAIKSLVSTIREVFTQNVSRLNLLLQDNIDDFAREMLQEQLIARAVSRNPNYTTVIDNFLAKLPFMNEKEEIEHHCSKFLKVLKNIGEQKAYESMKEKLVSTVKQKLTIDLHLD